MVQVQDDSNHVLMGLLEGIIDQSAQPGPNFLRRNAVALPSENAGPVLALCLDANAHPGLPVGSREFDVLARPVRLVLVLDVEARADARCRREQLVARTLVLVPVPQPGNE